MPNQYIINGQVICPTTGRWAQRRPIDVQGDNRPLYAPVRSFEMRWNIREWEEWGLLVAEFEQLQSTGTITVNIPAYPSATGGAYTFQEYSGCTLSEPQVGPFFQAEFPSSIALIIGNIRTE